MKLPKVRELFEAVKALAGRPYTSAFPFRPHEPYARFRGQPEFSAEDCLGCLACEEVCPAQAIAHRDVTGDGAPRRVMIHYTDTCIFCGSCEAACPADHRGIALTRRYELSFFDRRAAFETIEKGLQLCEICGGVIACRDHLDFLARNLGELAFSSPTLYQSRLRRLGLVDDNIAAALRDHGRSDRVKILCARCRRETTLTGAQ